MEMEKMPIVEIDVNETNYIIYDAGDFRVQEIFRKYVQNLCTNITINFMKEALILCSALSVSKSVVKKAFHFSKYYTRGKYIP